MVGDMGEVHLWGRGEGAVVSTCMQGWGIGRGGHGARSAHIRHRMRHAAHHEVEL